MPVAEYTSLVPETLPSRSNRNWQVHLFESNLFNWDVNPLSGNATPGMHTRVTQLEGARSRKLDVALNRPGQFAFSVPITSSDAAAVAGKEWVRCIIVFVDDENGEPVPVWSGPISNIVYNGPSASLDVTCVGWLQFLYGREFRQQYIFNEMDAGIIGTRILGMANRQVADDSVQPDNVTSAEDLLFGKGECDSMIGLTATGSFASGYPKITTDWAKSGSGSLAVKVSSGGGARYVQLGERFPVEPSQVLNVRGWLKIVDSVSIGTTSIRIQWYNSSDVLLSYNETLQFSGVQEREVDQNFTAPLGTAYGRAFVKAFSSTGRITAYWDSIYVAYDEVRIWPTPIELGTVDFPANPTGADRSRTYEIGEKVGRAFEELTEIESGFDIEVAIVKETIDGFDTYRRYLNIKWGEVKADTDIRGIGQDRPTVIFGYRRMKNNVSAFTQRSSSDKIGNRINARSTGRLAMAQEMESIETIGLWEDSLTISDSGITDEVLRAYAGAEVAYRSWPMQFFDVQPFPYDGTQKTYRFKLDFDLGDIVYTVADYGAIQVGLDEDVGMQPIRLFGLTIEITDAGTEKIASIQSTASA